MKVEFSQYGAEALAALQRVVATVKAVDPLAPTTIIVPSNIAGIVARRHLAVGLTPDRPGIAALDITTLARLAERLATPRLAPRRPVTHAVLSGAWRTALAADPGLFANVAAHPATVQALVAAHRNLRSADDEALTAIEQSGSLPADVVRLHRAVHAALRPNWFDTVDLLDTAAGIQPRVNGALILYLPQDLAPPEARLATALVAACPDAVAICGLTGVHRADRAVLRWFPSHRPPGDLTIPTATHIINASDSDDEVRCVVREVVRRLQHTPAHRLAVLYARQSPYARLLHEQLAAAEVSVNGPAPRAVGERAIARAFLGVLALADRDFPRGDVFRVLSEAPTRDFTGAPVPVSRWERISRSAGVVQGEDWDTRLSSLIETQRAEMRSQAEATDPAPWRIERSQQSIASAESLRVFVARLREIHAAAASCTDWRELVAWAADLFAALYGDPDRLRTLPAEEQYAAAAITTTLRGLGNLDAVDRRPSLAALRDALELALSSALPRVGRFGEGVYVGPLDGTVGLDLDTVFLVGLSEDVYPARVHEDALLPDHIREASKGQLPLPRDRIDRQHRLFLAAVASATTAVASFPRGDLRRSTERLPSRFLLPSLREISGDHRLPATEWQRGRYGAGMDTSTSFAGELLRTPHLALDQEWRVRAFVSGFELADPVVTAAITMTDARAGEGLSRFDGNLTTVVGLPDYAVSDRPISPTALESYSACPHSYFVRRLLGVEPLELPEDIVQISPADVGSLMHEVSDRFVREHGALLPGFGEPWTVAQRERLLRIAADVCDEYEQRGVTGHPRLWRGERSRILADLIRMLDADDVWHREQQARVRDSELTFGMRGSPAVVLPLPRGRLLMRGSADRVDECRDGTLVVTDIKTGRRDAFDKITDADPFVAGTKLQLPVYALAARQRLATGTTPVVAGYWFVRRSSGRKDLPPLTPELLAQYAETVAVLVDSIAAGLFPPKAPETADFAWVQCVYCNPDGVGYGDLRKDWERKRTDAALQRLLAVIEPPTVGAQP